MLSWHSLFLGRSFGISFKRVFHSNGIASKTLISTKYSALVRLLFCNVLQDLNLPSSDTVTHSEETFLKNFSPKQRSSIYTDKLIIPNNLP